MGLALDNLEWLMCHNTNKKVSFMHSIIRGGKDKKDMQSSDMNSE